MARMFFETNLNIQVKTISKCAIIILLTPNNISIDSRSLVHFRQPYVILNYSFLLFHQKLNHSMQYVIKCVNFGPVTTTVMRVVGFNQIYWFYFNLFSYTNKN